LKIYNRLRRARFPTELGLHAAEYTIEGEVITTKAVSLHNIGSHITFEYVKLKFATSCPAKINAFPSACFTIKFI
jgi:hypothetical protein